MIISSSHFLYRSGPSELRKSGFLYTCDWVNYEKREAEKKSAAAAAAAAAKK